MLTSWSPNTILHLKEPGFLEDMVDCRGEDWKTQDEPGTSGGWLKEDRSKPDGALNGQS